MLGEEKATERKPDSQDEPAGKSQVPVVRQERAAPPLPLDKSLLETLHLNWETFAWAILLILAIFSRFYELGERGMSHDESLHAVYSLDLYRSGSYRHDPMMHGPFLFHANAFIFFLFGVSDATARVMPALAGIGTVAMAWFFRRWIGRTGALLAGVLILLSPSLLFHSRYIRNDIYIVFFAMVWIYGMFRFVEERRIKWLYLTVAAMALGFATKENQFMTGTIFGVFLLGTGLWRWRTGRESLRDSPYVGLSVLFLTLVLPFVAPIGHLLFGWDALARGTFPDLTRSALLVVFMTCVSTAIAYLWFRQEPEEEEEPQPRSGKEITGEKVAGEKVTDEKVADEEVADEEVAGEAVAGRITFATWATLMGLFWAIEIVLFSTFFTNPVDGLATGIVGSLGYWLAQQEVQRGSQPWYYYILQGLLYEFLPLLLSVGGLTALVGLLWKGKWESAATESEEDSLPVDEGGQEADGAGSPSSQPPSSVQPYFVFFLAWWAITAWLAYSYAGEKMPWLMTHIAQPMAIFGGWCGGQLLHRVAWRKVRSGQGWWIFALLPALLFVLATLFTSLPTGGRDLHSLARTVRFIFALGVGGGLLYLCVQAYTRFGWRLVARLATISVVALLFLLTVRFSYLLTYVNYDMATEYLVYAHAAPDVKRALEEIETISERTVGGREIQVSYDDDVAWPMTWYMRFFPNHIFYGANPSTDAMDAPIILVGSKNYSKVEPYVARDYVSRTYRLVWWPEESYKGEWDGEKSRGLTPTQIWGALTDSVRRNRLWQIFFYRNHPDRSLTEWPHRHEFRMYVQRDIADIVWDLNVVPISVEASDQSPTFDYVDSDRTASAVYSEVYRDLPLVAPRSVAAGPNGRRYILDTGNNRVVALNSDGSFLLDFGGTCFLSDGEDGGCIDPDTVGPLELGDGQFREPWGIAVGADGAIFIADTWNGRIQVFDGEGNFLRKWGIFNIISEENRDPFSLFGPRGLAVRPSGNVLVADTGNKRILEYTPAGEFVRQVGGGGILLGRFEEPVDVAVHPLTGNVLVSDVWNRRIQVLSAELEPLAEWPMPTWESKDIWDKPYLIAATDGTVYATDPQFAQIFELSRDGQVRASFGKFGSDLNHFGKPTGLAIDPLSGELLVADADNNRVLVFATE